MIDATAATAITLDEEYHHLRPHGFHLQLPRHHKTEGGIPYATIDSHRKARAIVKLANALVLKEVFFVDHDGDVRAEGNGVAVDVSVMNDEENGNDDEDEDEDGDDIDNEPSSLHHLSLQCQRLYSQLTALSERHFHGGITQSEICEMILKVLRLLCATVEIIDDDSCDEEKKLDAKEGAVTPMEVEHEHKRRAIIHYDDVGHILGGETGAWELVGAKQQTFSESSSHPFALPPPTRQSLLNVALHLVGNKKDTLRGVSNSAIVMPDDDGTRQRLIISHHALLRMLLRTAPYLDEHNLDLPPNCSNGTRNSVLKRSVNLIRSSRRFFDQGRTAETDIVGKSGGDRTARQLWSSLRSDLQYRSHSHSCFRALILLYLFHPSKCSSEYYGEVLPLWMNCWRNIDRCPEWDSLWMVMFSRARKHVRNDATNCAIWSTLRKHLLSSCKYWLQIPVGGVSADKSFPHAKAPGTRSFPARLKVFTGMEGRYEEGIQFVGRLTKLLMFCTATSPEKLDSAPNASISGGTSDILRFLSFIKPYYNPSNTGAWTFPLGAFLHYLSYSLCARVGEMAGWNVLKRDHADAALMLLNEEPYLECVNLTSNEIVALLDAMLPLCTASLYSKNPTVSHAGETALLYLAQIDPLRVTPPLLDFSMRALDVSSVNLSHQAPAALSMLSRLLQPALRARPDIVLSRLPDMLKLTLAGVDGNDQNKSLRTLIFYRNLVMWVPVGGSCTMPKGLVEHDSSGLDGNRNDGTSRVGNHLMDARYSFVNSVEYKAAIAALPQSSLLAHQQHEQDEENTEMMQDAMNAMTDWSLMFLDRIYELLRAAGEQEKLGKGQGGTGMRHTSHDVAMTKNFSRIMKETLTYFFAAMDDKTYGAALQSVTRFLQEETLPFAAKDASLLCQALCSTRFDTGVNDVAGIDKSPGLDALILILSEDLAHKSNKCVTYRLRCLAGAVRYAGSAVLKHREALTSAISFAFSNLNDRVLFKAGCKLLRHVLSSQCEEYPIAQCCHPMRLGERRNSPLTLGMSALLHGDKILWHVPSGKQLDFSVGLLSHFALKRWMELGNLLNNDKNSVYLQQWRQTLRVMRYSIRGCSGILLDEDPEIVLSQYSEMFSPKEMATAQLILSVSNESREVLKGLRPTLSFNLLNMMCLIAKDTMDCESKLYGGDSESTAKQNRKNETGSLSTDPKILKEVIELSELLLARRGSQYQSSSGKTIYRGQKEILTDFALASEADFLCSVLFRCNIHHGINYPTYKDGEDSGKTVSRALLVSRIHLSNQDLTANASSQIPRRLRKLRGGPNTEAPASRFTLDTSLKILQNSLATKSGCLFKTEQAVLEVYEGLIDGLCALACHPNINVRADALSIVDFALSRYGWVVKHNNRPSRLLDAISLKDDEQKGIHGIPSCSQLVEQVNSQGKRSRLAEVVKGVAKIVALPRVLKQFRWGATNRFELVKVLCGTQKLLQLVPPEECPKLVHYVNSIFLAYRSMHFSLQRSNDKDQTTHEGCLTFLLGILQEGNNVLANPIMEDNDIGAMHWRDRLVAAWFVLMFIDQQDLIVGDPVIISQIWKVCFSIIEDEMGQPLQRVIIGLLGRLVSLSTSMTTRSIRCPDLCAMMCNEKFCGAFANALVFDHREDSSVSGGHSAQWSSGIEEIIRDSTYNIACRTLFPFNRIGQKSVTFKLPHSQLIEGILELIGHDNCKKSSTFLLDQAKELVSSPPSEDQKNQQCTAAEIFGGVSRALLQSSNTQDDRDVVWETLLLPFLEEAVVKMPTNLLGAFHDACRYIIHQSPPRYFFPLLKWSVAKVLNTLWQHEVNEEADDSNGAGSAMADRFALQGKWLLIFQAILVEIDYENDTGEICKEPFHAGIFMDKNDPNVECTATSTGLTLGQSWKHVNEVLTPCILNAIGHPYDKCRDHIASCLFRIRSCHRKLRCGIEAQNCKNPGIQTVKELASEDPEIQIMEELKNIRDSDKFSFKEKVRALGTARKFVSCCVHWGDAIHDYSGIIIPFLPIAFESLQTVEDNVSPEDRVIEAELVVGYRYAIADISSSCAINYGVCNDITKVLDVLKVMSSHHYWQIRQASAHFLRNFQGAHKFLFTTEQENITLSIAISLLSDDRREVSSAATSTLTGILAMLPQAAVEKLVSQYISIANKSLRKTTNKKMPSSGMSIEENEMKVATERRRASRQQQSVFMLSAVVMGRPYDTPPYIPEALAALSKHSFEKKASLSVREVVKMVCSEFKRTHTDNWDAHRMQFTQEQLEALDDVVSTPHYYV